MIRVQGPVCGGPGTAAVLCSETNVSACWFGDWLGLFTNVATGPCVPMKADPAVFEVTDEPSVSDPTP